MAKLLALLTTLLVVAHVATASYRAIITTVETIGSDNPSHDQTISQECKHKLQHATLEPCIFYLSEGQGGGRAVLLNQCCHQMGLISDRECICLGLKTEVEKRRLPDIMVGAKKLPQQCGYSRSPCQFGSPAY